VQLCRFKKMRPSWGASGGLIPVAEGAAFFSAH
jgi:hypothetical protein